MRPLACPTASRIDCLIRERPTERLDRLADAGRGRTGHAKHRLLCQPSGRSAAPASPPTPPRRHARSARSRSECSAKHFRRDTLAGLGGLSNGIRDGLLFRRELGVGQCPSDGARVVHTDVVLRRPRCQTADPCDPSARENEVGPGPVPRDTELTRRRSRRSGPDRSTDPRGGRFARRRSRRGIRRHRRLQRTSHESGRYPDQDPDTGLSR